MNLPWRVIMANNLCRLVRAHEEINQPAVGDTIIDGCDKIDDRNTLWYQHKNACGVACYILLHMLRQQQQQSRTHPRGGQLCVSVCVHSHLPARRNPLITHYGRCPTAFKGKLTPFFPFFWLYWNAQRISKDFFSWALYWNRGGNVTNYCLWYMKIFFVFVVRINFKIHN